MKKIKKKTKIILIILVLAISIGFAALATTLKINGSSKISKNLWHIYWENKSVNQEGVSTTAPSLSTAPQDDDLTIATWNVTLNLPGDFYEFTINAVNSGTLDAMISSAGLTTTVTPNNQNTPSTLPEYISYTVTYEDGTAIAPYHLLAKADQTTTPATPTKEAYKVRVEFTDDITVEHMNNIPVGGYSYTFTTQATYVQADDNAIERPQPTPPAPQDPELVNYTPDETCPDCYFLRMPFDVGSSANTILNANIRYLGQGYANIASYEHFGYIVKDGVVDRIFNCQSGGICIEGVDGSKFERNVQILNHYYDCTLENNNTSVTCYFGDITADNEGNTMIRYQYENYTTSGGYAWRE